MKDLAEIIGLAVLVVPWLAGIVFAAGFWSTAFSIILTPYAWFLVVERAMQANGWA